MGAIAVGMGLGALSLLLLGFKWELGGSITWSAALSIPIVSGVMVSLLSAPALPWHLVWGAVWGLSLALAISLLLWRFFRDPERHAPNTEGVIVSPADGTVIYVKPIMEGQIPFAEKQGRTFSLAEFGPRSSDRPLSATQDNYRTRLSE